MFYENAYNMSIRHSKDKTKIINNLLKELNDSNIKMQNELKLIIDKYQNNKAYILQKYNSLYTNVEKKHEQEFKKFKTSF